MADHHPDADGAASAASAAVAAVAAATQTDYSPSSAQPFCPNPCVQIYKRSIAEIALASESS